MTELSTAFIGDLTRRLTDLPRPFVVGVAVESSVGATVAVVEQCLADGADVVEVNLPPIVETVRGELAAALAPFGGRWYTTCRRAAFMAVYGLEPAALPELTDAQRMERQLRLIEAGSLGIDIELDTFDPSPAELSHDAAAIDRQRTLAATVRGWGGQAIFSCHTGRPQTADGLVAIVDAATERGADLVKVVTPCRTPADLSEVVAAITRLADATRLPFAIVGAGSEGRSSRLLGPSFGAAWTIGRPSRASHTFAEQPLIAELADARDAQQRARALRPDRHDRLA